MTKKHRLADTSVQAALHYRRRLRDGGVGHTKFGEHSVMHISCDERVVSLALDVQQRVLCFAEKEGRQRRDLMFSLSIRVYALHGCRFELTFQY